MKGFYVQVFEDGVRSLTPATLNEETGKVILDREIIKVVTDPPVTEVYFEEEGKSGRVFPVVDMTCLSKNITEKSSSEKNENIFVDISSTIPIEIIFRDTTTNEILGKFKEKDGLLTFEGKVDEAGKEFVEFVCKYFNDRINFLISNHLK